MSSDGAFPALDDSSIAADDAYTQRERERIQSDMCLESSVVRQHSQHSGEPMECTPRSIHEY